MTGLKSRIGQVIIPLMPVNRRTFEILRYEARASRTRILNAFNPIYHAKITKLRRRTDLQVNVGSGGKGLPGWVNIELARTKDTTLCLDVRRPLPFADGSVRRLICEHVIEHLDFREDVPNVLSDWVRVLKLGGVARIVVPDLRVHVEAYVSTDSARWAALGWNIGDLPDDIRTPMHILNHMFHQGGEHLFGYDFETLAGALKRAGFSTVHQAEFGRSIDPELAIDQENHAPYSLYVDAVK